MEDELRDIDRVRRNAMISADTGILADLLSDELVWTHSSGKTDNKDSILEAIGSHAVSYESLSISDDTISRHGNLFIHSGRLDGQASRDGVVKELKSRFLSVWKKTGNHWTLLAWQSTGCA